MRKISFVVLCAFVLSGIAADVTKCSYAPKGMSVERAEFLRRIAMKAMQK